jgi:hypothetical protein
MPSSNMPRVTLEIGKYIWAIILAVMIVVICVVQCNIFSSRKHLYAENKKGYLAQAQIDLNERKAKQTN